MEALQTTRPAPLTALSPNNIEREIVAAGSCSDQGRAAFTERMQFTALNIMTAVLVKDMRYLHRSASPDLEAPRRSAYRSARQAIIADYYALWPRDVAVEGGRITPVIDLPNVTKPAKVTNISSGKPQ